MQTEVAHGQGLRRLLIVGSSGFLGRQLVRTCRAAGVLTTGIDVPSARVEGHDAPDVWLGMDVATAVDSIPAADACVFAAQAPVRGPHGTDSADIFRVNALGAFRVMAGLASVGGVPLLHCSTGSVYRPSWTPLSEGSAVRSDDAYALSKLHAESMDGLFPGRLRCSHLRIFGLYGPRQRHRLVPAIAGRIRDGRPVHLAAGRCGDDGGLRISLLHVEDAADAILDLARRMVAGDPVPRIVNLASDDAPSIHDVASRIGALIGARPLFERAPPRPGNLIADASTLAALVPGTRRSFDRGIADSLLQDPTLGDP